jgi:membrane-bound lytic murein transglycosylase D
MIIRDPQKYGMDLGNGKMPALSYETVETNKSMRLPDIARKLDVPEETLNVLNAELRHRITPDKPYKLRVPTEMTGQLLTVIDEIPQADTPRETFRNKRIVAINHKVTQGETLVSIAGKYKTTVGAIRTANHLSKKDQVAVGQRLTVPIQSSTGGSGKAQKSETIVRHKVKKGDSLASLARKYGVSSSEIKKANHLESDKLKTGQTLRIEKGDVEANREQKKESPGNNKKGPVKAGARAATEKTTDTSIEKTYTVKKGDSLIKIARENNTTLEQLRQLNKLSNDNMHPGQVVKVK